MCGRVSSRRSLWRLIGLLITAIWLLALFGYSPAYAATGSDTITIPRQTIQNWVDSLEDTNNKLKVMRSELDLSKEQLKNSSELIEKQKVMLIELQTTQSQLLKTSKELLERCETVSRQNKHRGQQRDRAYGVSIGLLLLLLI